MSGIKNIRGVTAVIDLGWGDSGKGRLIDDLAQNADIVARYSGGSNTGHTIQNSKGKFALHIIPSGIFNPKATCLIGRGVALDLESLIEDEFEQLKKAKVSWGNLIIDGQCTLTMPWHKLRDGLREKTRQNKIGTTGRGVGPTYADRVERVGLRLSDLIDKDFDKKLKVEIEFQNRFLSSNKIYSFKLEFKEIFNKFTNYAKTIMPYIGNTVAALHVGISQKKNILFEGAQGWLLDIDGGTYPYVTSSNTGVVGIWRSFDLHPSYINNVIGITKAYMTRVGAGPMPTKITVQEAQAIIEKGHEVGTTSGRTRDPGWLDLVAIKYAANVNQINQLAITKLDVLSGFKKIKLCIGYKRDGKEVWYKSGDSKELEQSAPVYKTLPGWDEDLSKIRNLADLPKNAKACIKEIENNIGVKVSFIGVGPNRQEAIYV